jgi:hypothetical protein
MAALQTSLKYSHTYIYAGIHDFCVGLRLTLGHDLRFLRQILVA